MSPTAYKHKFMHTILYLQSADDAGN